MPPSQDTAATDCPCRRRARNVLERRASDPCSLAGPPHPKSTALRFTLWPPWSAPSVVRMIADVGHVNRRGPWQRPLHPDIPLPRGGDFRVVLEGDHVGTGTGSRPCPRVCNWPLRGRAPWIGGLPESEDGIAVRPIVVDTGAPPKHRRLRSRQVIRRAETRPEHEFRQVYPFFGGQCRLPPS